MTMMIAPKPQILQNLANQRLELEKERKAAEEEKFRKKAERARDSSRGQDSSAGAESSPGDDVPSAMQLMPFDAEYRADPHPRLKRLRERCPVARAQITNQPSALRAIWGLATQS